MYGVFFIRMSSVGFLFKIVYLLENMCFITKECIYTLAVKLSQYVVQLMFMAPGLIINIDRFNLTTKRPKNCVHTMFTFDVKLKSYLY